ncbi:MAG: T9SS C-terminal target domain-containing protein [Flavobacteriia bacterium]|nr:T9SS C-terminal target domain-containing protein [Flavobacteriia bacterium]
MKLFSILFLFLLTCGMTFGQNMQKPSAYEIQSLPTWAKMMYGEQPNLFEVSKLYSQYFNDHPFEKNYHTQYYKRWIRKNQYLINDEGFIVENSPAHNDQTPSKPTPLKSSNWSVVGPITTHGQSGSQGSDQTNVYSVDQCAGSPLTMICGTEPGEVYKSSDGGLNWTCTSMSLNFQSGVTAVEISPTNPGIFFAGGNAGIFRSIDGGSTWVNVLPNTNFGVNEILMIPGFENIVLAATDKGLYRSNDGGSNWSQIYTDACFDLKCKANNASEVYLVKHNPNTVICEFLSSSDAGASWTVQSNGWYNSNDPARNDGGARIAVTPDNPNRIYVYLIGESKPNDLGFIGIYKSDDAGLSWVNAYGYDGGPYTAAHPNLAIGTPTWLYHQGFYNCAILANPNNANEILIGGLNMYRSMDGGATFTSVSGYVGGPLSMHVDNQDFRQVNGTTWITTDGGIYKSTDFVATQPVFSMSGVHGSDYWGFGSGWNEDVLVGGLYHNGNLAYHENYGDGNFLMLGGGEAPTGYVNPGENRKTYYSDIGGRTIPLTLNGTVNGAPFGMAPNESYWAAESSEFEFHPNCYSIGYIGKDNSLWKTTDAGASFNLLHSFGNSASDQVKYIEIGNNDPNIIYLNQQPSGGNLGILWKSTNGGQTWNSLPIPPGNSRRMLLTLDPQNDQHIYIAYPSGGNGNKTFESTNGGASFLNITNNALNNQSVQSITHIAGTNGGIYCATENSVYYRNATTPWAIDNAGLPQFISGNILKPFYRDHKIRLASYGKGIWESAMNEVPSQPICRINVNQLAQTVVCAIDSFYFEDHSFFNHANGSWSWTFPTGSPSTSNQRNPAVFFNQGGGHLAVLQITDQFGNTDTDSLMVYVNQFALPGIIQEDFETTFLPNGWSIANQDNGGTWTLSSSVGGYATSSKSAKFDNYGIDSQGSFDDLIFNINGNQLTNQPLLTFDVAYARWGGGYSDSLFIGVSTDCGATYQYVYYDGGATLATAPDNQAEFIPDATQWRTDTVNLSAFAGNPNVQVAFRNKGAFGNNLYLDNINIGSNLGIQEVESANIPNIYPNPLRPGGLLQVSNIPASKLTLFDGNGKRVWSDQGVETYIGTLPTSLSNGWYLLQIQGEKTIWNYKVIVN